MSKLVVAVATFSTFSAFVLGAAPEVAARRRPPPQDPPQLARCDAHAPVMASVFGHVAAAGDPNRLPSDTLFSVRESGRWDFATVDPQSHVVGDAVSGCLDVPATDKLRAALRAAPWKTTPIVHCMAMSQASTEYFVGGKVVWTQQMCPPVKLDTVSAMAIAALDELVGNARKAGTSPPPTNAGSPPPEPQCPFTGAPLFKQKLVVDDVSNTFLEVEIYASGGWLRAWHDSKQPVDQTSGCLTPTLLQGVRAQLRAARWQHTINRITCRAFSPRHTIYSIDGKQMWDQHLCGADTVDESTMKALDKIRELLSPIIKLDV